MFALILFMAIGFVLGWAIQHPIAWVALLLPIGFAIAAGSDLAIVPAILGLVLTAVSVVAGRWFAERQAQDEPREPAASA